MEVDADMVEEKLEEEAEDEEKEEEAEEDNSSDKIQQPSPGRWGKNQTTPNKSPKTLSNHSKTFHNILDGAKTYWTQNQWGGPLQTCPKSIPLNTPILTEDSQAATPTN